jgi:hypothetical protein
MLISSQKRFTKCLTIRNVQCIPSARVFAVRPCENIALRIPRDTRRAVTLIAVLRLNTGGVTILAATKCDN